MVAFVFLEVFFFHFLGDFIFAFVFLIILNTLINKLIIIFLWTIPYSYFLNIAYCDSVILDRRNLPIFPKKRDTWTSRLHVWGHRTHKRKRDRSFQNDTSGHVSHTSIRINTYGEKKKAVKASSVIVT